MKTKVVRMLKRFTQLSASVAAGVAALAAFIPSDAGAQQKLVLTPKWTIAPGSRYYLPTSGGHPRAVAINKVTGNVLIPSLQGGSNHVQVVSGVDGSDLGSLGTGGPGNPIISGGFAALLGIGAADDGVIYAANGDNSTAAFKIYRWSAEDTTGAIVPTVAFGPAAPGLVATRIGDSFFVRGSGNGTQIIASGTGSPYFTIFTTVDGTNFTANQIAISSPPGSGAFSRTVAFDGVSAAFYGGGPNVSALSYMTFNIGSSSCALVSNVNYSIAMGMSSVRSSGSTRILAGIKDNGATAANALVVYDMKDLSAPAAGGSVAFPAGGTADGNITGGTDIDSAKVVGLSTQNGVVALDYGFQTTVPPSISTQPSGGTVYAGYNLTVSASGDQPLHYQWQTSNSNTNLSDTFTNIPAATADFYAVTAPLTTNYYQVLITNSAGSVTSTPVQVAVVPTATSPVVTNLWRIAPNQSGYPYLSTSDDTRGIAYDPVLKRVVIASRAGGLGLHLLDGDTGANLGDMDISAMTLGGTFSVDQVVAADDGVVYTGNLDLTGLNFILNRWSAATTNSTATLAYQGGPGGGTGDRWGDTMTIRGAGTNTQILVPSRGGTNVAIFTTFDGTTFFASVIAVSGVPKGFAANGIAFGAGDTFWAKSNLGDLWLISFTYDWLTGTGGGTVLQDYSAVPRYMGAIGVDPVRNILAGADLQPGVKPNDLKLFQLTGSIDPPVLFDQVLFATANINGNANTAVAMKYPRVYALDVNNGVVAAIYGVPPSTAPTITTRPADLTVYTNDPAATLSVSAAGSIPLYYQWRYRGNNPDNPPVDIPNATNNSYVLSYPPVSASGFYDVVVRNLAGTATSAPPTLLTVVTPASSTVVTQLWAITAGSRPYLDGYSYSTRGLAYDTNTETVLLATHTDIYAVSATNGSDLFQMNTLGLPNGYFTIDQIAAADDGALYACNLTLDGTSFSITRWDSVSLSANLNAAYTGTPVGDGQRLGDTLAVRGAGTSSQILAGTYNGSNVVLFTTADGSTFDPTTIWVTNAPYGFAGQGITFGSGNTFWAKSPGYNLRQVAFDPVSGLGGVIQTFVAGTEVNSSMGGICVDPAANILAGVVFTDVPNDMQLLALTGNTNPPVLFSQTFFQSSNPNSQLNSVTVAKGGKAFGLNVNNGVVAVSYGTPILPVTISSVIRPSATSVTITFQTITDRDYQVEYKNDLTDATWTSIGPVITAIGATASYTDTTASGTTRYYRVHSK